MIWMLEVPIQYAAAKRGSRFVVFTALSGETRAIPAHAIRVRVDPDRPGTYMRTPLLGVSDAHGCVVSVTTEARKRQWERKLKRIIDLGGIAVRVSKKRPAITESLDVSLRIE